MIETYTGGNYPLPQMAAAIAGFTLGPSVLRPKVEPFKLAFYYDTDIQRLLVSSGNYWEYALPTSVTEAYTGGDINSDLDQFILGCPSGTTAERPAPVPNQLAFFYDTTIMRQLYSIGTAWSELNAAADNLPFMFLSGPLLSASNIVGVLSLLRNLSGTIISPSVLSGSLGGSLSGAIAGLSVLSGTFAFSRGLSGTLASPSVLIGNISIGNVMQLSGAISAPSVLSGTLTLLAGVTPGTTSYTTPGPTDYVVPNYNTLQVELNGGGAGGGSGATNGAATTFLGMTANGGKSAGSGGTAAGGTTNVNGSDGNSSRGGGSPNGGANQTAVGPGNAPGGGARGGSTSGSNGGGGSYSTTTYTLGASGAPAPGSTISATVGAGGAGAQTGAAGRIRVTVA